MARKWGQRWPARSAVHGTLSPVGKTEGSAQGIRSWGWKGVGRREGALQRGRWRGCCSREGAGHSHSPTTSQRPPAARCCPDAQGGAGAWTGARLHGAAWRALLQPSCSQRSLFKLPRALGSWPTAPMTFRGGGHLLREAFSASCPPIRAVPGLRALGAGTGTTWGTRTRVLKSRDTTLVTKVHTVKAMVFPVVKYCCLGNPMDRGAWLATVHEVA